MSLTKFILRFFAPLPKLEAFDRYLFIGPHPDDIEIGAGAAAAKLAGMGKQVRFLIATDGRYGTENTTLSGEELILERQKEAVKSAKTLGVTDVRFLPFSDGAFYSKEDLLNAIAREAGDFRPDVIFAPDPDVHAEAHMDHLRVGNAAKKAACFSNNPGIMHARGARPYPLKVIAFYMTARPNRYIKTGGKLIKKQLQAIFGCHKTQFPEGDSSIGLYIKIRALDFGIRSLKGRAEGFRAVDALHMHCLPESD